MINRLFIILLLNSSISTAQVVTNRIFDNTIGGENTDLLTSILKLNNNTVLLCGTSNSSVGFDKTQSCYGSNDYWLVKIENSGKKIWDKRFGGNDEDNLIKVLQDSSSNFYLLGHSISDSGFDKSDDLIYSGPFYTSHDFWIIKCDSDFNKLWDITIGGSKVDYINDALVNENNEIVIAGSSSSNAGYNKSENSIGYMDFWIVKLDSNGTLIWDNTIGGNKDDKAKVIVHGTDFGYLIGGISKSEALVDKSEDNIGLYDIWLCKINDDGFVEWDNTIGGTGDDYISSIIPVQDGGYLISGYSNSEPGFDKTDSLIGGFDYWVIRINSNGEVLWDKTFGGIGDDILVKAKTYSDSSFILGGYSDSDSGFNKSEDSWGFSDFWLVKMDTMGNFIWDKTFGSYNDDILSDIIDLGDEVILTGGSSSSGSGGDKSEIQIGETDYWTLIAYPGEVVFLEDTIICPSDPIEVNEGVFTDTEGYYYFIDSDTSEQICYVRRVLFSDTIIQVELFDIWPDSFNGLLLSDSSIQSYTFYFCDDSTPVNGIYFDSTEFNIYLGENYYSFDLSDYHYGFIPNQTSYSYYLVTYVEVVNKCGLVLSDCEKFWILNTINDLESSSILPVVYPNPADDIVNVKMPKIESGLVNIKIFTINGGLVRSELIMYKGSDSVSTNIADLSPGTFVLILETESKVYRSLLIHN